jgi:hypothetical protein
MVLLSFGVGCWFFEGYFTNVDLLKDGVRFVHRWGLYYLGFEYQGHFIERPEPQRLDGGDLLVCLLTREGTRILQILQFGSSDTRGRR